jgi:hypothetical protein
MLMIVALSGIACGSRDQPPGDGGLDRPVPRIGRGPGYAVPPAGARVEAARPVGRLRCGPGGRARYGAHLEVFASRLDVVIPAGIGIAPPRRRDGAYVRSGRCQYPARTVEPTGLIEIDAGTGVTLGELFDLWGQPLSRRGVLGFRARKGGRVAAFVNGTRWTADPRAIPLRRHAAVVVEVNGFFPPSRRYAFPNGL